MKTSGLQDHALVGCRDGYRDQIRRQGDQETRRARDHIVLLVNRKNSMRWWVREGQSLEQGTVGAEVADASSEQRPATAVRSGQIVNKSTNKNFSWSLTPCIDPQYCNVIRSLCNNRGLQKPIRHRDCRSMCTGLGCLDPRTLSTVMCLPSEYGSVSHASRN